MLGYPAVIDHDGLVVKLRPPTTDDLPAITTGFASLKVHLYTGQVAARSFQQEEEWLTKKAESHDEVAWLIEIDKTPIGITGIHRIDLFNSCTSGITIWDTDWWGKGVATRAHLARTFFAADFYNRYTIRSQARTVNLGSVKALQRVGYHVVGIEPRTAFRKGKFIDSYSLVWWHPERLGILFPEGVPEEYRESIDKAAAALELARRVITY